MIRPWLFSLLLLSGPLCFAQSGSTATYSIHGTVVDALTNQCIARAEVILNQEFATLTDGEGRFEFEQIPATEYQVSLRRPGYVSVGGSTNPTFKKGSPQPSQPARRIRVGPNMPELVFRLTPEASIKGQIRLSTADPADEITVSAYQKQLRNGVSRWVMVDSTTSDSNGAFQFGDLSPSTYMLHTEPSYDRSAIAARGSIPWGFPSVYYPGVTDSASAGTFTLSAGQSFEADITVARQPFYPLTARVRGADSGSPGHFQIQDSVGLTNLLARYDSREQIVQANVPNGSWILRAQSFRPARSFGRTGFQVTNGPVNIGITILPAPKLQVTVHREFTSGSESPAMGTMSGPGIRILLESADPIPMGNVVAQFDPNADPNSDTMSGSIDAAPGRYWITASTFHGYVSSMTSGGVDLLGNPLVISSGSSNAPIEVVLRNDSGTIWGRITGRAGSELGANPSTQPGEIPAIYVYAIPLSTATSTNPETNLSSGGKFAIPGLAPGSYRVVACDSEQEFDTHSPEGLAAWTGKGEVVRVDPGGTATVELNVVHVEQ